MKLLLASLLLLSSVAGARSVSCDITESKDQKEAQSQVILPVAEKFNAQVVTVFGVLSLNFLDGMVALSLPDTSSEQVVKASLSARDGDTFRLQMFPFEGKYDYLDMYCSMDGEEQSSAKPTGAACTLVETSGNQKVETKFQIPVAQSGHEVFALPASKLLSLSGWVMAYNGVIVNYIQSNGSEKSITSISAWDRPFSVSWNPAQRDVVAELKCEPLF